MTRTEITSRQGGVRHSNFENELRGHRSQPTALVNRCATDIRGACGVGYHDMVTQRTITGRRTWVQDHAITDHFTESSIDRTDILDSVQRGSLPGYYSKPRQQYPRETRGWTSGLRTHETGAPGQGTYDKPILNTHG